MRSMKTARADSGASTETRNRPRRRASGQGADLLFDADLFELPRAMRWREWMGRVEAAIFASPTPVSREALSKLVGRDCNLDDLIADIRDELRARPYDLVLSPAAFSCAPGALCAGDPRRGRRRSARRRRARTDADRDSGRDGDRLSATRHPRRTLEGRRQRDQPRRHRRTQAPWVDRRRLARAAARRAIRLCDDEEIPGSVWTGKFARLARYRKARRRRTLGAAETRGRSRRCSFRGRGGSRGERRRAALEMTDDRALATRRPFVALSRRKQGFESPSERQLKQRRTQSPRRSV